MSNFLIPVRLKVSDSAALKIKDAIKAGGKVKSVTVRMEATHSGIVNGNNWLYTPSGMAAGVKSFVFPKKAPVTLEHDPESPILGHVIDSKYVDYKLAGFRATDRKSSDFVSEIKDHLSAVSNNPSYKGLGHIELISKITDSDAIEKVLNGEYIGVSVGGVTDSAICSICGTDKKIGSCEHERGNYYGGEKAFLIGGNMKFDHITYTARPADKNAAAVIIRDSEDVSSSLDILDFEIETKDKSMKITLAEAAKSHDALVQHAGELGIKDFVIQTDDDMSVADYLFSDAKTYPIADAKVASVILDFLETKVEQDSEAQSAIEVLKDKLEELGVKDHKEVIADMVKGQEALGEDEESTTQAPAINTEELKQAISDSVIERLQEVLTVQDSFSATRVKALSAENRQLRQQLSDLNTRLRDSLVDQICAIEKISDSAKIEKLKQRSITSLQDKLEDLKDCQIAPAAEEAAADISDSEGKTDLGENSVTLDNVPDESIKDSEEPKVEDGKAEETAEELKVLDSKTFKAKYAEIMRSSGIMAAKAFTQECREKNILPQEYN